MDIYVSWVKGLPQNKEALNILKDNNLGIEMSNIDEQVEMVKDAGVKFSSHTPGMNLTLNLAKPDYMDVFEGEEGARLLKVIRESDNKLVSFHCGYSAEKVYKMIAYPDVPTADSLITNRNFLINRIINNVTVLEKKINEGLPLGTPKQVILETLDYSREKPIPWEEQHDEAKQNKNEIEKTVEKYGINAGILYVTDPFFIKEILDHTKAGFLFDVGHVFISADAKRHDQGLPVTFEDYFNHMLEASTGRTYQMHLTVPEGSWRIGYADHHHIFTPGEGLSEYMFQIGQEVIRKSPELSVIALEMRTKLEPVEHAKEMVKQRDYAAKRLNI